MMAEAESRARDRDLTELERELEASFVADLGSDHEEIKTAVLGPESAPTVQMPREIWTPARRRASSRPNSPTSQMPREVDVDSTSKLRGLERATASIWISDRLANALGSGDTVEQPRAEDEVFSTEVFEASQRSRARRSRRGRGAERRRGADQQTEGGHSTHRTARLKADDDVRCRNWSR